MKSTLYPPFLLLIALLMWHCNSSEEQSEDTENTESDLIFIPQEQWDSNAFKLIGVHSRPFSKTVEVSGMVEAPPYQQAVLTSLTGGHLQGHNLLEGQFVKKGQRLMSVENPELVRLQREYLEISRQLSYLQSEMQRQKTMSDEQISARKNYQKAKSEYETSLASYHGIRKELSVLGINPNSVSNGNIQSVIPLFAPISGYITDIMVVKGSYVSPETELLRIVDNTHLHVELKVFEHDALRIRKGQQILFKIPEVSNDEYEAEVHLIGNTIDENRTVSVHAHMKDDEVRLFPGMFVDAKIVLQSQNESCLPQEAMAEVEGKYYGMQFVKKDKEGYFFKTLELPTGDSNEEYRVITKALPINAEFLNKEVFSFL